MSSHDPYKRIKTLTVLSALLSITTLVAVALLVGWFMQSHEGGPLLRAPRLKPAGSTVPPVTVTPRSDLSVAEKTTIEIFQNAAPSVVFITKLAVQQDPFRRNFAAIPRGTGSGFVWDKTGHIVTNYHVIQGGNAARVTLADQSVWSAKLVGFYDDKDLAVLRIDAPEDQLKPIVIGNSEDLIVGQHVFAIGNPFGLDHTLSTGVVSGIGREIPAVTGRPIQGVIQTDAAINPGNSGGPLLDSAGRLIGVNTQIFSPSGASAGVGFAVPVDTVRRIVPQLIAHGRVTRPGIGVSIDEGNWSKRAGIRGALVIEVQPGSAADKAGIKPTLVDRRSGRIVLGDVIVKLGEHDIREANDLFRALDHFEVGQHVEVTVARDKQQISMKIQLMGIEQQ